MKKAITDLYRFLFARNSMQRVNQLLFQMSLSGLGIGNFGNAKIRGEGAFLERLMAKKRKFVVLDVGANVGDYTNEIIKRNASAEIYCFEPHPATFGRLSQRFMQSNIHVINAAVGEFGGSTILYDYANNDGSTHASLYPEAIEVLRNQKKVQHEVRIVDLSTFLEDLQINIVDLLKIDTEGHELSVLRGADSAITDGRFHAIQFEFNEMNAISRTFFRDFSDLLSGYDLFRVLPNSLLPLEGCKPVQLEIFGYQNIVALKKGLDWCSVINSAGA